MLVPKVAGKELFSSGRLNFFCSTAPRFAANDVNDLHQ